MQKKSKYVNDSLPKHISLSIQFSLDGFSFCIANSQTNEIVAFTEYVFDVTIPTPELLLIRVQQIFNQNKDLQSDFDTITVIHQNNLSTLVPVEYFSEAHLKTYLNYTIKTLADDYVTFDTIDNISCKNVYIPYVNINNFIFKNFGEFEFKHHSTLLIDKLVNYSKNNNERSFFVYVSSKSMDIVVTKGNELLLYNSFSYTTKEDFLYYILFVAEQLQFDTSKMTVTFLGAIEKESELYTVVHNYIHTINFIENSLDFFNDTDEFSSHSNYILVS